MVKLLIGLIAAALVASACTSEAPGQAVPTHDSRSAGPPTSTSMSRIGQAPSINSPELDLKRFEGRVCDLLTPAQLGSFAVHAPGKATDEIVGPVCTWNPPDTSAGARVTVDILSKVGYGWEGVFQRKGRWALFEEAGEINGYPAVHIGVTEIDVTTGTCVTTVGVNRDLVFEAGVFVNVVSSPEYKNPCSVSDRVASMVIDTVKGSR